MVAGGYIACVAIFVLAGVAFAKSTGQNVYAYFALHALSVGALALTFPPFGPAADAVEHWHISARIATEGMVLSTTGLLMAHLLLPTTPTRMRWVVRLICPAGAMLALASLWFPYFPHATIIYGLATLVLLIIMAIALVISAKRGSSEALFLLIALAPLIVVGLFAATLEALGGESMQNYPEAMLIGFAFELLFVFYNLSLRLRIVFDEREIALADARRARRDSETDALTGLPNRRVFDREIQSNLSGRFTALAVVDCDHFKKINDRFGHAAGDAVLRSIARIISNGNGMALRIGGEEFGLFVSGDDWHERLEKLRCDLPLWVQRDVPEVTQPVTVSIGAIALEEQANCADALQRADEALYHAKQTGRDRVVVHIADDEAFAKPGLNSPPQSSAVDKVRLAIARSKAA